MSEIKDRLKEAAENCIASYEKWSNSAKDTQAQEALLEAVHELRKVAARLEIEIAVTERRQASSDPIPIPAHRASRRQFPAQGEGDESGEGAGNGQQPSGRREFRDRQGRGENVQTVRIRRPETENAPAATPAATPAESGDAAPAEGGEGDDRPRRNRPLSLKRPSSESDDQG